MSKTSFLISKYDVFILQFLDAISDTSLRILFMPSLKLSSVSFILSEFFFCLFVVLPVFHDRDSHQMSVEFSLPNYI